MIFRSAVLLASTLALYACDTHEPGIEVELATTAIVGEATSHGFVTFRADDGAGIEATHLHLAVASLELVECPTALQQAASAVEALFLGTAYAHSTGTPLYLGVPHVIDAARTSSVEQTIGVLEPPPGRYCKLRVAFGPADADAVGLDANMMDSTVGRTMVMRGLDWSEGQAVPLSLESKIRTQVEVGLTEESGELTVLELDEDAKSAVISYDFGVSPMLQGYDPNGTPDERARAVIESMGRSIRAIVRRN